MTGALVILAALIVIGAVLYVTDRLWFKPREERRRAAESEKTDTAASAPAAEESPAAEEGEGECCGMHITCEKDSLSPFTTEAEYYDDEELDAYRGRGAEEYTPEEEEEFRNVLYTMRPDEIAGWARSLQIRGVTLPAAIREEVLLIVGEERARRKTAQG